MTIRQLTDFERCLIELERGISKVPLNPRDADFHQVRRQISACIRTATSIVIGEKYSLADHIEAALKQGRALGHVAVLLVRGLSVHGLFAPDQLTAVRRSIISIVIRGMPETSRRLRLTDKLQPYEAFAIVERIHEEALRPLDVLLKVPMEAARIVASRQEVMRGLGDVVCREYLQPFGYIEMRAATDVILSKLAVLLATTDDSYSEKMQELKSLIDETKAWATENQSFLTEGYYSQFLSAIIACIADLDARTKERFDCDLAPRRKPPYLTEKRYPLHHKDRSITINIPAVNRGPGVALDVVAEVTSTSSDVVFENELRIGDVKPGDFTLSFALIVIEPCSSARLELLLSWGTAGTTTRKTSKWLVDIVSQNTNVDWSYLASTEPYSLEVAEGSRFVGRAAKVQSLAARFLKERMSSSFISGQKRIGKTSLALAVKKFVEEAESQWRYHIKVIEYGLYAQSDPVGTVEALGWQVFDELSSACNLSKELGNVSFRGSLATLNRAAQVLQKKCPKDRFIFVLDEFDELPPEAYRLGPLAEAFFSNLRTFSAQQNIAFLLVGGEKMPYVMHAQGDQLNKFAPEQLTYFQRSSEWNDYVQLVREPIDVPLNIFWSDSALNLMFDVTFGHPYYTKLICARVFATAVSERDGEITDSDVKHAVRILSTELDSNSFAHIWKDGINADGEEAHVRELQRTRALVAIAKTLRANEKLTLEAIQKHNTSARLQKHELGPVLQEFCRRDILRDVQAHYEFVVPLFQAWLKERGVTRLVPDSLAEELEVEVKRAEDAAYVTSNEITQIARRWPTYRGEQISSEEIRAWLEQVPSFRDQRLLFKLLEHVKFISHLEVRERLRDAHRLLRPKLPEVVFTKKTDRRRDVLISYVDGAGKSGAGFAALYAEENSIDAKLVVPPGEISKKVMELEEQQRDISAVVIVDDIVATGGGLSGNVQRFAASIGADLKKKAISVLVVALTATRQGADKVRQSLSKIPNLEAELVICELLDDSAFAFPQSGIGFWTDDKERDRAKALCLELGARIYRDNPLGYGGLGLLVTFTQTCPNNTLPIIHSWAKGDRKWNPIFPRPTN